MKPKTGPELKPDFFGYGPSSSPAPPGLEFLVRASKPACKITLLYVYDIKYLLNYL